MATKDGDFVTAEGLAKTLEEVGVGGSSPLDAWPVNSVMVLPYGITPSMINFPGAWKQLGYVTYNQSPGNTPNYFLSVHQRVS